MVISHQLCIAVLLSWLNRSGPGGATFWERAGLMPKLYDCCFWQMALHNLRLLQRLRITKCRLSFAWLIVFILWPKYILLVFYWIQWIWCWKKNNWLSFSDCFPKTSETSEGRFYRHFRLRRTYSHRKYWADQPLDSSAQKVPLKRIIAAARLGCSWVNTQIEGRTISRAPDFAYHCYQLCGLTHVFFVLDPRLMFSLFLL